jgi:hypothetical protein
VCPIVVGYAVEQVGPYFPFDFAHLAFCAAAIRARPSALIFLATGFELTGRPRFVGVLT